MNIRACIGYLFCSFEIFNKIRVKYDMTMVNSERTGLEKSQRFTKYWWSCCNNLNIMPYASIVFYIDACARVSMWRERAFCHRSHFVECSSRCVRQTMNNFQLIPSISRWLWMAYSITSIYLYYKPNESFWKVCKKLTKQTLCLNRLVTRRDYVGERETYIICWAVSVLFISNWSEYRQLPYHWMVHVWFLVDAPTDIVISLVPHLH